MRMRRDNIIGAFTRIQSKRANEIALRPANYVAHTKLHKVKIVSADDHHSCCCSALSTTEPGRNFHARPFSRGKRSSRLPPREFTAQGAAWPRESDPAAKKSLRIAETGIQAPLCRLGMLIDAAFSDFGQQFVGLLFFSQSNRATRPLPLTPVLAPMSSACRSGRFRNARLLVQPRAIRHPEPGFPYIPSLPRPLPR
jgi:hypothetical protein